jgi:hypothetical protein
MLNIKNIPSKLIVAMAAICFSVMSTASVPNVSDDFKVAYFTFTLNSYGDQGVDENISYTSPSASITGTPTGAVTYTLSGPDAALFTINSSNGVVSMVARDFEAPLDADTNNLYSVVVTATDTASFASRVNLDVVVFEVCGVNLPASYVLSAPDSLGDTSGDTATLQIELLGPGGNPLSGVNVIFSRTSGSASIAAAAGFTDAFGIYTTTVSGGSAGISEFTALFDSTGDNTPNASVTAGSPSLIEIVDDVATYAVDGMVGIGTETPDASTVLEVAGTDKGVLIPRIALTGTSDTTTISSPALSLLVYNTNAGATGLGVGFVFWNGTAWQSICAR